MIIIVHNNYDNHYHNDYDNDYHNDYVLHTLTYLLLL